MNILDRTRSIVMVIALAVLLVGCGGASSTIEQAAETVEAPTPTMPTPTMPTPTMPTPAAPSQEAASAAPIDATTAPVAPTPVEATPTEIPVIPEFVPPTGIIPFRIEITAIGVDAPTIDLSLGRAEPEVPEDFADTGWYTQTRLPGEIGPAVIAGHIDSRTGPAVFAELDQLSNGDEITVYDEAGEHRSFVVVDAEQYPKGDLPDSVFGFGAAEPELRLITCGGTFDADAGHYRDNYVVFARLLAEGEPTA